jgi:transposase-like protein
MSGNPNHVREALALFADELSALRYLEQILWANGACCPRCGHHAKVGKLNGATTRVGTYKCYKCRKAFSVLHGTLLSASHVPAHKWLQAMYLTEGGTKPMRAHRLGRILNVSFKTAASMMRRLESAAAKMEDVDSADARGLLAPPPISDAGYTCETPPPV